MNIKPHVDRAKNLLAEFHADVKTLLALANVKLKQFAGWLGNKLIAYYGKTETQIPADDYYTKWREEKEKRVRLEAELAELIRQRTN